MVSGRARYRTELVLFWGSEMGGVNCGWAGLCGTREGGQLGESGVGIGGWSWARRLEPVGEKDLAGSKEQSSRRPSR